MIWTRGPDNSWPCPQCGGPTVDDENGYHCRCGVKITFAELPPGCEDGPPEMTDDVLEGSLDEIEDRIGELRRALALYRQLGLWNDGETPEARLCDAVNASWQAIRWLSHAKSRMGRFFERSNKGFRMNSPFGDAITLIDADAEIKRVARGEPPPPKNWWEEL